MSKHEECIFDAEGCLIFDYSCSSLHWTDAELIVNRVNTSDKLLSLIKRAIPFVNDNTAKYTHTAETVSEATEWLTRTQQVLREVGEME